MRTSSSLPSLLNAEPVCTVSYRQLAFDPLRMNQPNSAAKWGLREDMPLLVSRICHDLVLLSMSIDLLFTIGSSNELMDAV